MSSLLLLCIHIPRPMDCYALSLGESFFLDADTAHETDQEHNTHISDFLSNMQTYNMEFDVERPIGKPPCCFVRVVGDLVAPKVILRDPNHNELEVSVVKKYNKIYFEDGWCELKDIYHIPFGAWVTLTYIEPKLLLIRIINRFGREVEYPQHNPPLRRLLTNLGSSTIPSPNIRVRPLTFVRTYVKKMTFDDIHSGTLVLPWYGFGERVFYFEHAGLALVDHKGTHFHCKLTFGVDRAGEMCCKVSNGWIDFCKYYGLAVGDKVRFCVTDITDYYMMYVCVYPHLGIETTIDYPLTDGSRIPLYISQRYFVAHG
ncbi:hypothetical protein QL285_033058 [Trifolium repens]|nr:hypothetical protein QL285_033058 [Trifolium repens]